MPALTHVATHTAPFAGFSNDVHSLRFIDYGATVELVVQAGFGADARIQTFELTTSLNYQGQNWLGAIYDGFHIADDGTQQLDLSVTLTALLPDQISVDFDAWTIFHQNSGLAADATAVSLTSIAGNQFLIASRPGADGLAVYARANDGALSLTAVAQDPAFGPSHDHAIFAAYGQNWIVSTDHVSDAVQSYLLGSTGMIAHQASYGAVEGLGINKPTAMASLMIGGQPFVVLASGDSNSLSVLRLEADGSFTATDHILDDLGTRFADAALVEAVSFGDFHYVIASGSDDGLTLLQVLDDGTLVHLDTLVDTNILPLANLNAASLSVKDNTLHLATASSLETGLAHFSFDLSTLGDAVQGSAADDLLTGTALDDVLMGQDGDDTISAGAGRDRLIDGAGSDRLTGGTGADIFVLLLDYTLDFIDDFERNVDGLDLTHYPLLHDMSTVTYTATSWGAELTIRGDVVEIRSDDGATLTLAELTVIDPFMLDRPPLILSPGGSGAGGPNTQVGTATGQTMTGSAGDDILSGNGGDDTLMGGLGADQLLGGSGFDTASYANATSGLVINMAQPSANTGEAAGDTFGSIEAILGSGYADTITGDDGREWIDGGIGHDQLFGRAGQDTLNGGPGDDLLNGGTGADHIDGGAGRDTASYTGATAPLRADLSYAARNKGDALGDSFTAVEDLLGSSQSDALIGDNSANLIDGGAGNDWLQGGAGDDTLIGGAGNDIFIGDQGADVMTGGAGRDRVDYIFSRSAVTVDLSNSANNAQGASGDTLTGIEDLSGSLLNDRLTGNATANALFGLDGDDWLTGGLGNDWLSGGADADTFVFGANHGHDVIADFQVGTDTLRIDDQLLGNTAATDSALLAKFATTSGDNVVLNFGGGNSITLESLSDPQALLDHFAFF